MARKKSSVWKILLLVVGIPLAIVLGLLGCSLLYELTAKEVPAGDAERAIVPTAAYVAGWMEPEFQPDANAETLTKKRYFDDAHEVAYEYDHPDVEEPLYIYCTVSIENSTSDAKAVYAGVSAGGSLGASLTDATLDERDDLFRWGDQSACWLIRVDGAPVGNAFVCRSGSKVFDLWLSGIYFDDPGALAGFLKPLLERMDLYVP